MVVKRLTIILILILLPSISAYSEDLRYEDLPVIQNLKKGDPLFDQVQSATRLYQTAIASRKDLPPLLLLRYQTKAGETLTSIASRLGLPLGTLATMNRMDNPGFRSSDWLLVPNVPGIYLPDTPVTGFEKLLAERMGSKGFRTFSMVRSGALELWRHYSQEDFKPDERLRFLGKFMIPPLESYRISSRFGNRVSPLTGTVMFHPAIDLVAPLGSPVQAVLDGVVRQTGFDGVYGNYAIVDHSGGYRTFYAHLLTIRVRKDALIRSGGIVGTLGNTGQSTGAHLHFELYKDGKAVNPENYIRFTP